LSTYQNYNAAACTGQQSLSQGAPSFTVTLEDRFAPHQLVYATTRGGYLVGGFNNQVYTAGGVGQVFEPEKVIDFEMGLKSDWSLLGRPIRTNVSGFFGNYKNQQRVQNGITAQGVTYSAVQNAGSSSFYGSDIEINWLIFDALELSLAWDHVVAYYNEFSAPLAIAGTTASVSVDGASEAETPKDVVNVGATVKWPVPSNSGTLSTTLTYFWRSETTSTDSPVVAGQICATGSALCLAIPPSGNSYALDYTAYDKLPSFGLYNLTMGWKGIFHSQVDANFWVKNLFNKSYLLHTDNQLLEYGWSNAVYGNPRELGLDVRYNF
jgi:iron complex outermembrane receptor protein